MVHFHVCNSWCCLGSQHQHQDQHQHQHQSVSNSINQHQHQSESLSINKYRHKCSTLTSSLYIIIIMRRVFGWMETADGIHQFKSWLHFVSTDFLHSSGSNFHLLSQVLGRWTWHSSWNVLPYQHSCNLLSQKGGCCFRRHVTF